MPMEEGRVFFTCRFRSNGAPADPAEAAQIRKLAHSHHAPYDCKQCAHMIALALGGRVCAPARSLATCAAIPKRCANALSASKPKA